MKITDYKKAYLVQSGRLGAARRTINKLKDQIKKMTKAMASGERSYES